MTLKSIAIIIAALGLAAASPTQAEDLLVTQYKNDPSGAPYGIALEKGFFKAHGLDITGIISGAGGGSSVRNAIASDLGYRVTERAIAPSELTLAEEVFLTGTAAELVPVREVDGHRLGEPGEITRQLQERFEDAIYGRAEQYREWLDIVEQPSRVTS